MSDIKSTTMLFNDNFTLPSVTEPYFHGTSAYSALAAVKTFLDSRNTSTTGVQWHPLDVEDQEQRIHRPTNCPKSLRKYGNSIIFASTLQYAESSYLSPIVVTIDGAQGTPEKWLIWAIDHCTASDWTGSRNDSTIVVGGNPIVQALSLIHI